MHLPLLYPHPDDAYRDENDRRIAIDKKPQLTKVSQGRIIRVHLPLLYPSPDNAYRDELAEFYRVL